MKPKVIFLLTLFLALSATAHAQEEIILSTYYPAPFGEYDELAAENLFCDRQIIGNMDVNGDGNFSTMDDIALVGGGNLLVEGRLGIGTTNPGRLLELRTPDGNQARLYVGGSDMPPFLAVGTDLDGAGYGWGMFYDGSGNFALRRRLGSSNYVTAPVLYGLRANGNVGIGTASPWSKLHVATGYLTIGHRNTSDYISQFVLAPGNTSNGQQTHLYTYPDGLFSIYQYNNGSHAGNVFNITNAGNVGIGTTSPDSSYRLDVNGSIKGGGTAQAWSANNTSFLNATSGGPWAVIPGLSISFNLSRNALVQFMATGTQRTPSQAAGAVLHCQYRFTVDGTPRGHPTYGQRIQVSRGDVSWWNTWSLSDFVNLNAGSHSIEVQACNGVTGSTAVICGEIPPNQQQGYAGGNLNILAVYQ